MPWLLLISNCCWCAQLTRTHCDMNCVYNLYIISLMASRAAQLSSRIMIPFFLCEIPPVQVDIFAIEASTIRFISARTQCLDEICARLWFISTGLGRKCVWCQKCIRNSSSTRLETLERNVRRRISKSGSGAKIALTHTYIIPKGEWWPGTKLNNNIKAPPPLCVVLWQLCECIRNELS